MFRLRLACLCASLVFGALPSLAGAQLAQADVREGRVTGLREGEVTAFLGLPYAGPPVGANRWKPPVPPASWTGVRKAETLPTSCQQYVLPGGFPPWTQEFVTSGAVGEDCLYVNLWTPAKAAGDKLPVMVWFHGGAFTTGSASVPIYDGSALAAKGVIVITVNYRVGLYGFMAHPELTAESPAHASGNYGLLDQVAALKWVQANVAAFGGDPDKVTIAGQSAGAASVNHLIATPLAKGLFARAVAQSYSNMGQGMADRATGEKLGLGLMAAAGATSIADLRGLTTSQLADAFQKMNVAREAFRPIVDGFYLPDASYVDANINDTPIITGMTADEMTGADPNFGKASAADVTSSIERTYGDFAPSVLELYPARFDAQAVASARHLQRDRGLATIDRWARQRLSTSRNPLYAYLWTHPEPGPESDRFRAFHSSEIPYVFATLDKAPERGFAEIDYRLSALLGDYWVNWIKHGDPNGPGLPHWPRYSVSDGTILEIGDRTIARPILTKEQLELFDRYVRSGGRITLF